MATVYVKSVEASSWSRTTWDNTGATNYIVGDRVIKNIADGSAHENLGKTYVCIVNNNSTTDPETDVGNWARVGFSEEYPFHAPDGNIATYTANGEVYLDGLSTRYKNLSSADPSFWWNAQDFGADSEGTIIFFDGTYNITRPIPGDKINYVAKNQGKVTFNLDTTSMYNVFAFNDGYYNRHEGINYQVGGTAKLFSDTMRSSFINCVFTDENSIYGNYTSVGNNLGYTNFVEFENCLINLPNSFCHIAGHNLVLGPNGRDALWKNSTFIMQFGNVNQYEATFFQTGANSPITLKNCVFYIVSHVYSDAHIFMGSGVKATNCIAFSADNSLPEITSSNSGLTIKDPLFIDASNGDVRLRPSSPLVGGGRSSKFPADAVWMQEGSGTGTGTESDPYYFSQFADALIAAASTNSKQVVCKDGAYRFTTGGEHFRDANLGSVTFIAENRHKAVLSAQRGVNPGPDKSSLTLKLKDFKLTIGSSEHFIHTQFVSVPSYITFDNCYINFLTFMSLSSGSSFIAKSCIIEKGIGISAVSYFISGTGASGLYTSCTFVDRNNYTTTTGWNHSVTAGMQTFKNCIFRTENATNTSPPGAGTFTQCIAYNYNTSNYSDTEVLDADPLMVNYDISSHEDSNYQLRPSSPGIGGVKSSSSFPNSYIWVTNTSGTGGTGTEEDPYYFGSLDQAYTDAGSFGSVVFKNGVYDIGQQTFTFNSDTQANNVNYYAETTGGVEFIAQRIIFGHGGLNVTQSLNYTGLKIASTSAGHDNFLIDQSASNSIAAHIFSSCELQTNHSFLESSGTSTDVGRVIFKNTRLSKVSATNYFYLIEQRNGNTNPVNLSFKNCIIENFLSTSSGPTKIFRRANVTLKGTIIIDYSNNVTGFGDGSSATPSLITSNCITREDGLDFYPHESNLAIDPLFVDPAGGNFSLRPNSPLIGKG